MPFSLHLLGLTELKDAEGRSVDAVLAQPKRLALLAYLMIDPPPRFHRRDDLLLRFWPDKDEAHARGALSQALAFLRRHLGEEVVLTRGANEVGIDRAKISCDVERFEQQVEAGTCDKALATYQGDLFAAFHLDGDHEFDEWVSVQRARLRERAVRCAKAVVRAAERAGDGSRAVLAGRQLLLLAPLDESAAISVLTVLAAAGRPALAIAEYEAFRRRLRDELGVEPSAGLQRLVDGLRSASPR